jgi:dienelactone hydrolase
MMLPASLLIVAVLLSACASPSADVRPAVDVAVPPARVWNPPARPAPAVVVLSGYSGPELYEGFAAGIASQGYWVALLHGRDVFTPPREGTAVFRRVIEWVRQAPGVRPGKVAVIGFSWGGAATLAHAVGLADSVSVAIVYYPYTAWIGNPAEVASSLRVPTLALAGVQDRYRNCCPIEIIRAIDAAAHRRQARFTLVAYPEAGHGFDLAGTAYREADADDAWRRTLAALRQHHAR